jgi:formiminoglutamase
MALYISPSIGVWQGRVDGTETDVLRWHQIIESVDLAQPLPAKANSGIAFIGFCCDEGVNRNKGRIGAKEGPFAIRKACCNFPLISENIYIADAGDVLCDNDDLEGAQQLLGEKVAMLLKGGFFPVVLGGGHEVAYANFLGVNTVLGQQDFGIINFDAHFDIRALQPEMGASSGTGIWQINEHCAKSGNPFHYVALGIQRYSNTRRLFDTMAQMDSAYILAEDFTQNQKDHILHIINCLLRNAGVVQLTIDMDVFAVPYAPGVSAQAFNGILPDNVFKQLLRAIVQSGKLVSIDIAETNPLYDIDSRTSRLAAAILFDIVYALCDSSAEL